MISKTIGFRGLAYFQTNPYDDFTGVLLGFNYDLTMILPGLSWDFMGITL